VQTPIATLELIAHREGAAATPVRVRLFAPELSAPPSQYACTVELQGIDSTPRHIYGEGSMQALCLAAQHAIQSLVTFAEHGGKLTDTEGAEFDGTLFGFQMLP